MTLSDDVKKLIDRPNFAHLATLMPDGQPQALLTWIDTDGEQLLVNTEPQRQRARNVARDSGITVLIQGPTPWEWAEVRGRVMDLGCGPGQVARYLFGLDYPPRDLRFALEDASAQKIGSPLSQPLRMLCFAYDADTGRYSLAILRLLRLASGLTLLSVACLLWRIRRKDQPRHERKASPC